MSWGDVAQKKELEANRDWHLARFIRLRIALERIAAETGEDGIYEVAKQALKEVEWNG